MRWKLPAVLHTLAAKLGKDKTRNFKSLCGGLAPSAKYPRNKEDVFRVRSDIWVPPSFQV